MSTIFSEPTKINIICCFLFSLEQWWEWWNGSPLNKFLKCHWFSKLLLKNLAADCWSVIPPSSTVIGISDRREIVSHSRPPVQTLISMHWKILLQPILNQDCTTLPPAFVNVPACWVIFSPNRNRNVFAKQRTISVSHWLCCEFSPHLRLKKMTQWQGEVVGTERPFYRQMKLNPITIRLCNSVDQSNIFSLNNLEIH